MCAFKNLYRHQNCKYTFAGHKYQFLSMLPTIQASSNYFTCWATFSLCVFAGRVRTLPTIRFMVTETEHIKKGKRQYLFIYSHCVVYSRVHKRYRRVLRFGSVSRASSSWFCNWRNSYLLDGQRFVSSVTNENDRQIIS